MQNNKSAPKGDIITFTIGVCLAAVVFILLDVLLKKVAWPVAKWGAKKAWAFARNQFNKPKQVKTVVPAVGLPTPDIFKGAPNLGPMQEFKLK